MIYIDNEVAGRGGFEPPEVLPSPVFKTEFICFTIKLKLH